jgi:hypothetical protein
MEQMPPVGRRGKHDFGTERWELPPLILHPFADQQSPGKLLESSKAGLMLSGLLPSDEISEDELTRKLLEGRVCEIRMLYFVGKDLCRWTGQCLDFVSRIDSLASCGLKEQSFSSLLIEHPPDEVEAKLRKWGVNDFRAIFSRALGLNAIFRQPPSGSILSEDFLHHYYRYADHLFACRQSMGAYTEISAESFHFELYASGEYPRLLEREWGE